MPFKTRLMGVAGLNRTFDALRMKYSGRVEWVVGTNVEYSVYVEFGTYKMAAQPYLRPAVERVSRNLATYFKTARSLSDAIRNIALDIERTAKQLCPVDTGNLRASIRAVRIT